MTYFSVQHFLGCISVYKISHLGQSLPLLNDSRYKSLFRQLSCFIFWADLIPYSFESNTLDREWTPFLLIIVFALIAGFSTSFRCHKFSYFLLAISILFLLFQDLSALLVNTFSTNFTLLLQLLKFHIIGQQWTFIYSGRAFMMQIVWFKLIVQP